MIDSLLACHRFAAKHGGRCLSTEYLGYRHKHLWECARGHQWTALKGSVAQGKWCPECWHPGPEVALERLQALAAKRGGRCLSAEYLGVKHKYLWECAKGHRWEAPKGSIYMGVVSENGK